MINQIDEHSLTDMRIRQLRTAASWGRSQYSQLAEVGWKFDAPLEPDAIDKHLDELLACQAEIRRTNPATPAGSKRLEELLAREKFLTESLNRLEKENDKSVDAEYRRYFDGVEELFTGLRAERATNDAAITSTLAALARLLQARWDIATRFRGTDKTLEHVSIQLGMGGGRRYSSRFTSPWNKNFGFNPVRTYEDLVTPFFQKVSRVFGRNGAEVANPEFLADAVFKEK